MMPAFIISLAAWIAKNAFLSGLVSFWAPFLTGILKLGGSIFTAIGEIIISLSKSPEGRVVLALLVLGIGFLFMRHHYIEQGRAAEKLASAACSPPTALRKGDQRSLKKHRHVQH